VSGPWVVELERVTKRFRLHRDGPGHLKVALLSGRRPRTATTELVAVSDVTLRLARGESLGLIGPNGSGKSTLLRLMAGILQPSSGSVRTTGRVAPLVELGAGFHPELTGRENAYMNASLFGLHRREIDALFEPIVAFSELWDFIDEPVKNYSLGMQMRLGFAVAVHVHADVLLLDEVLAVGDADFQAKCLERIAELRAAGAAIVIVSHDSDTVARLSDRVVLLAEGRIVEEGRGPQVAETYRRRATEFGFAARARG